MNYIPYLIKFLYRIRYWLVIAPILVAVLVGWKTRNLSRTYTAYSTIYTGMITGFNILSENGVSENSATQNSMMDNLLNIVTSDQTLKHASLRLYARSMVYGDPDADNLYIKANNYKSIYNHGKTIHHLIDKSSDNDSINEIRTYENLLAYEKNDPNNYVYGIYWWNLPYFNRKALKKVNVTRDGRSDMLELSYTTDDPGIAYQTLRILNDEFIRQYQILRFGETNNVIAYFEAELARAARELREAEDSLTKYSVEKKVINYDEETKQVAALNTEHELSFWRATQDYESSLHLMEELEKRMGISAEIYRNNTNFLSTLEQISDLNRQLLLPDTYNPEGKTQSFLAKDSIQKQLQQTETDFLNIASHYGALQNSKEGISNDDVVGEWLKQILIFEKSKSILEVMKNNKEQLDSKYIHYAPVGSTLNRKERSISIAEKEYFTIMSALNSARLRQKSLQMTSATLKVMNEPVYPVSAEPVNRKKIILVSFFATLIFILFFFLLIELLDHTLRNKLRVEMIAQGEAVGAFTRFFRIKSKEYNRIYTDISTKHLCNFANTYFKPEKNNIINIISNEPGEGKSYVLEHMATHFSQQGMEVKKLSWHNEFETDAKAFIQSLELPEPDAVKALDNVILVEYPSLREAALTKEILSGVSLNLLVVDSRRTWKDTDQRLYQRLTEMAGSVPLLFVLNYTTRDAAEEFNGLMPPYTFFRKLFYRLSQLGFTAKDRHQDNYV